MVASSGKIGEDMACEYLLDKGYEILGRNIARLPHGEIDILCRDPVGTLVYLEVKTIVESLAGYAPEDHATQRKLKKMRTMAQMFSAKHRELVDEEKGWRIDLLAITLPAGVRMELLTYRDKSVIVNHYENVG